VALVLAALLTIFFWTPLSSGGVYLAADQLQSFPLHRVAPPGYRPRNPLLTDPVYQMAPWLIWSRDQVQQGRLPLWNPYNGWGAPHLANFQSAVFSPYSLPFYLLDPRAALLAAAVAKLGVLGGFAYLFLRRIEISHPAALVGMVAYTFCGYHVVWLNWPHIAAAMALPAGLYWAECFLRAPPGRTAARGLALLGLAVVLAVGVLAGHPETLFFGGLVLAAYLAVRLPAEPPSALDRARPGGAGARRRGAAGTGPDGRPTPPLRRIPARQCRAGRSIGDAARLHRGRRPAGAACLPRPARPAGRADHHAWLH
jgi:hypothetical protein